MQKHSLFKSFKFAFDGLKTAFSNGRNFKIQLLLMTIGIALALILDFSSIEWAILIVIVALVLILEIVNTSLESIVNLVSPDIHPEAKIAKDMAASAVLMASIASLLIGALLFLPKII